MTDSICCRLRNNNITGVDFIKDTTKYFNVTGQHLFQNNIPIVTGNLDNMRITASENSIKIVGSLCKYYLGDNMQTLTRSDNKTAIEKLSNTLHLPIQNADLSRIDIANNLIVKYEPEVYFNHLGNLTYFKRALNDTSLYYYGSKQNLIFYDKVREQKAKGQLIPEIYKNRNVLRYELRFLKNLCKIFNLPEVKVNMLYSEPFYIDIVNRWHTTYTNINKINEISLNFGDMKTVKELELYSLLFLINSMGGELKLIEQINEAQKRKEIDRFQKDKLKKKIISVCKNTNFTNQTDVITELNQKVNDAAKFYQ